MHPPAPPGGRGQCAGAPVELADTKLHHEAVRRLFERPNGPLRQDPGKHPRHLSGREPEFRKPGPANLHPPSPLAGESSRSPVPGNGPGFRAPRPASFRQHVATSPWEGSRAAPAGYPGCPPPSPQGGGRGRRGSVPGPWRAFRLPDAERTGDDAGGDEETTAGGAAGAASAVSPDVFPPVERGRRGDHRARSLPAPSPQSGAFSPPPDEPPSRRLLL